jgi:hypothetical protein
MQPGPLGPGQAYEFTLTAGKGQALSFATMLGESNDWFFAPGPEGIPLYDSSGQPLSGDITSRLALWDAGTEVDQEPAVGPDTGPRQSGPDQGAADSDRTVRRLGRTVPLSGGGNFTLPALDEMIRVTVTPGPGQKFTVRVENRSTPETLHTSEGPRPIHISRGIYVLHTAPSPLFEVGRPDRGEGLEAIAEAGSPSRLASTAAPLTGVATGLSPGVWAVHGRHGRALFTAGARDRMQGLEPLAEAGNAGVLAASLMARPPPGVRSTGAFDTPVGQERPGPIRPGDAYELEFEARPGQRLSLATMYGASNDWFFAPGEAGLALFDEHGDPRYGDVTSEIYLWDAGTEQNEELATGPYTGPQQPTPDSGPGDPDPRVRRVSRSEYAVPPSRHLRATLIPVDQWD